ncbi:MAG: hypothetical protein JW838_03160 [Spirochaetes bacterium]|nr:hypothetical protein [Spirochaetota bacterium]
MTITEILDFILNRATKRELEMVGEALRRRGERESSLGPGLVDVNRMARSMAEGIEKQMGIGSRNMKKMTRRFVADMILKEKPDISDAELERLLDLWVPGGGGAARPSLPKDVLLTMITQFTAYGTGEMSAEEKRGFPRGWYEKYWNAFPPGIQKFVKEYIHGRIGREEFWRVVRQELAGMK